MPELTSKTTTDPCPRCGEQLSEPISGDVHCYVECSRCGARFELDDPELSRPGR